MFWGKELDRKRGLTVVEIMQAVHAGRIKGMYVEGENPATAEGDFKPFIEDGEAFIPEGTMLGRLRQYNHVGVDTRGDRIDHQHLDARNGGAAYRSLHFVRLVERRDHDGQTHDRTIAEHIPDAPTLRVG